MADFNGIALLTDSTAVCLQYDIVGRLFMEQAFEPDLLQKLHLFFLIEEPQKEISSLRLCFNLVFVRILEWTFVGGMVPLFCVTIQDCSLLP